MTTPSCFGKHWNPNEVECKGGLDPTYNNPKTGTHIRDKCSWYAQCAPRTCANTMPQQQVQQQIVPPGQLIARQPTAQSQLLAPVVPAQPRYPLPVQPQAYAQPYTQQPQYSQQPVAQTYYGAPYTQVNQQQLGMQVLGYLTIPEPMAADTPWYQRLYHEVVRSMLKGAMHTGANFFDHTTMTRPKPPGAQ